MKAYAGIDLHSTNNFIGIMDEQGQRLYGRRLNNDPSLVLAALDPYKKNIEAVIYSAQLN